MPTPAIMELQRRLVCWLTETWMRAAENPASLEEANNCKFCKGDGQAHFCLSGEQCTNKELDDCVHPTQEEAAKLKALQEEAKTLILHSTKEIKSAIEALLTGKR